MNRETEQIPELIFDWLDTREFAALDESEKAEVLKYLSAEEYDDMRDCCLDLKSFQVPSESPREAEIKQSLVSKFRQRVVPQKGRVIIWEYAQKARKIAAVALIFGAGWFCHYLVENNHAGKEPSVIGGDTVYLESSPGRTFDTVYIEKTREYKPSGRPAGAREEDVRREDAMLIGRQNIIAGRYSTTPGIRREDGREVYS